MERQGWNVIFLKVGHYVASKSTKLGECIILCSHLEQLPVPVNHPDESYHRKSSVND